MRCKTDFKCKYIPRIGATIKKRGGGQTQLVSFILPTAGECTEGGRVGGGRSALVLDAACLHLVLHYVSLSHISILLWGSPSIQKRLVGSRTEYFIILHCYGKSCCTHAVYVAPDGLKA